MEEEEREVELHPYLPEQAEESIKRTAQVVAERDSEAVTVSLGELRQAAGQGQNIMPATMEAVRAYATLGEITAVLKDVYGEFREPVGL